MHITKQEAREDKSSLLKGDLGNTSHIYHKRAVKTEGWNAKHLVSLLAYNSSMASSAISTNVSWNTTGGIN